MTHAEGVMRPKQLERLRPRIGKWLYKAQRQSFLRDSKRCGFYNDELEHGGPSDSSGLVNQAGVIPNEQTPMTNENANLEVIPESLDLSENPRPNKRRRDAD